MGYNNSFSNILPLRNIFNIMKVKLVVSDRNFIIYQGIFKDYGEALQFYKDNYKIQGYTSRIYQA